MSKTIEKSYVTIEPFTVETEDNKWGKFFGPKVYIHGGCELVITKHKWIGYVTATINDPYYPPIKLLLEETVLKNHCNSAYIKNAGPFHARGRKRCTHREPQPGCLYCVYKWWKKVEERQQLK